MAVATNVALSRTKTLAAALILLTSFSSHATEKSDAAIKKAIIADSIASYSGSCPCPYNTTRNGSRCGGRSAYSKPGGYAPICYEQDVSASMVKMYKSQGRSN
ncbi:MAG: hypothetical protein V4735_08965 [Pseudomonadota bacterium]